MSNIFTSSWDETKPDGDRDIPLGDDDIREFKQQVRERLEIDHHALASEGTDPNIGFHDKVTLLQRNADYDAVAATLVLYGKLSGSYTELFARHENVGVVQWSILGKLNAAALGIASEANGDILRRVSGVWSRLGIGTTLQQLRVNAGATDIEYFTPTPAFVPNAQSVSGTTDINISPAAYGDMAGMSITLTTTGRPIKVNFAAAFDVTGAFSGDMLSYIQVMIDGVSKCVNYWRWNTNTYFGIPVPLTWIENNVSAGEHTIKIQWKTDGGANALGVLHQYGTNGNRVLTAHEL